MLTKPDWTSAGKEEDHAVSLSVVCVMERVTKTERVHQQGKVNGLKRMERKRKEEMRETESVPVEYMSCRSFIPNHVTQLHCSDLLLRHAGTHEDPAAECNHVLIAGIRI